MEWEWFSVADEVEVHDTLFELLHPPDWMRDAACREHPEVEFFPERGQPSDAAKRVCGTCLCRVDCLDYALDQDEQHGIWGGLAPGARKELGRAQPAA